MAESIHIPAKVHFHEDPALTVREAKQSRYIVQADVPKSPNWIAKSERDKRATRKDLEVARQEQRGKKRTFEQQLAIEQSAESNVMVNMLADFDKNAITGNIDFLGYMSVQGYVRYQGIWREMGGPGMELGGFYSFMRSPYYWELPIEDISSWLFADLLIGHSKVKVGDQRDIHHLATAVPVAHYVVADNAMVDRCRRLGIDTKWNTNLFSTRTLDGLCNELESLT
jgi:hypothetical protein